MTGGRALNADFHVVLSLYCTMRFLAYVGSEIAICLDNTSNSPYTDMMITFVENITIVREDPKSTQV